mgnify:CR=1 FL=1
MNPEAQEVLNKILAKSPAELNRAERDFLRARRSYLKPVQVEEYKEVLEEKEKPVKVVEQVADDTQPPTYISTSSLQLKATELGINPRKKTREQLEELIKEAENK